MTGYVSEYLAEGDAALFPAETEDGVWLQVSPAAVAYVEMEPRKETQPNIEIFE